jgi:two-component system response regulator AtoC
MQTAQSSIKSALTGECISPKRKPLVLFVDDDTRFRELLVLYLRGKGFDAISAGSATEARELVEKNTLDLAVVDVDLGMDDGLELLGFIKQRRPELPVVVFTEPNANEGLIRQALEGRASGFVRKGQSLEKLVFEIRLHLHVAASLS